MTSYTNGFEPLNERATKGNRWATLVRYRFLVEQLVRVNIYRDFKRSFIGLSWLVVLPLIAVATWILLHGAGVVNPGATDIPYPAFVLLSTSIWGFFMELYKRSSNIVLNAGRLLVMTPFPHEVLIIEQLIVHLIHFSIPFALNLVVLLFFGVKFSWVALLFPLTLLPLLLLGLAIGLIVALLRIVSMDISNLIDEGMRVLMFLTPVVYAPRIQLGWLSDIIRYNPLTYLVSFSRDVLTKGTFYEPQLYLLCCGGVLLVFTLALRVYRITQPRILERIINV